MAYDHSGHLWLPFIVASGAVFLTGLAEEVQEKALPSPSGHTALPIIELVPWLWDYGQEGHVAQALKTLPRDSQVTEH